jgi:hypothetical protein
MKISGRTRVLAAVGAAVALTLTGPAYAGGTTSAKATGKPVVGECRSLTLAQASAKSDTSAPIDCAKAHNSRVIAVRNLPPGTTYADLDTNAKLLRAGTDICYPAFRTAVGGTDRIIDRTAYTFLFFRPTAQQAARGARWLRCDLAIVHGSRYGNLPTDAVPALKSSTIPASAKRCLAGTNHVTTTCTATHNYRATGSFTVSLKTFPGTKRITQIGRNRCPALVSTDRNFLFSWKPKQIYNGQHDRTVVCYSHTSS